MTHKTKGIVLRTVKYGESSLVVTVFTELFGVQTYMANGVRSNKKSGNKSIMLQAGAILDMEVYHNELKNLQRIKESSWAYIYNQVMSDVVRNSIALFMVELLFKSLRQPEGHPDLFYFSEDILKQLDTANPEVVANLPLYFTLQLPYFFGFKINESFQLSENENLVLDLAEGKFTEERPSHTHVLEGTNAMITAELLRTMHPDELKEIKLNRHTRRDLLSKYLEYYALHLPEFGQMKTWNVLQEVIG